MIQIKENFIKCLIPLVNVAIASGMGDSDIAREYYKNIHNSYNDIESESFFENLINSFTKIEKNDLIKSNFWENSKA
jgi:hypothetical protein